ncbi:uncharacterized protein LOC21385634 [Morus notabilis]|nr:uncharacterized protein LOC21385634 [Morus notabilis]XP_024025291.1 uncharacterized protein LOC21385634 [Morus notabilis]XP_024025292.1 uncharacterized protein LOC21385634 [Morus notabilis]
MIMASEPTTKVRLVRCPKCRLVLPELPEFNVYKCGGCNATLQAKNRVNNVRNTGSGLSDVDPIQENLMDGVREDKEELSSGDKVVLKGSEEYLPCENNERDQSRSEVCEDEQLGGANLSSKNQNNGSHRSDSSDCDNEVFSPTEFVDHKNEEFALNENDKLAKDGNNSFVNNGNGELAHDENVVLAGNEEEEIAHNESEEFAHDETEEFAHDGNEEFAHNDSGALAHDETEEFAHDGNEEFTRKESEEFTQEISHDEKEEFTQSEYEDPARNEIETTSLAGADLEVPVNHESSVLAEENTIDTNKKSATDSDDRSSNAFKSVAAMEDGSNASAHVPVRESIVDTLVSSSGEQLKQPQKGVHQGYANLKSEEFNSSSELSDTRRDMTKSPTRSSRAYDGSISSYDALDDQFPMGRLHSLEDTSYKAANFLHSKERPRRDKFMVPTMINRESEMQHQARPSLSDKKTRAVKNGKWDRGEFLEPARHDRTVRNWRLERHEHQPSSAFHRSISRDDCENGGPSNRLHNEFHRRSSFQSHDLPEDHGQVMKLLRMVFEVKNQLDKSHSLYDKGNDGIEGFSRKERYNPRYHNYEASSEERFHHPDYARYYGRFGSGINYSNRSRLKKMPFSGDATGRCHQVDPSCSHCFPQDWPRSAQLPPSSHYNTSGLWRAHPGHNYSTSYSSCPSSPLWSVDSEYPPWGRETQSDDLRRRTHDMTNYLRDNDRLAKRHFRPIAGGAPFIVCYKCFKLLQLPADFLLFKRKCHRLRCGACSEVLKFSLQNGSHIAPFTEKSVDTPPPSEAEDNGDEIERRNMASTSQALDGDPVSCNDDYAPSYRKSCSIEADPISTTPFHTPLGRRFDKRILYGSSDFSGDSKELAPEQSPGKYKNRVPMYESAGPPSNTYKSEKSSSEIGRLPPRSTSPLHRLMGYSSPSQVIFGTDHLAKGQVRTL